MTKLTVKDAVSCAKQFGKPWALCEMWCGGVRCRYVRALQYTTSGEFIALDGVILAVGYPDGSFQDRCSPRRLEVMP